VPLLWTSVWWKPYYLRERINLFTYLLKFSSSLDEIGYRGSQQKSIERLWVLWESAQWKLTFSDGRKWLSALTFLIFCPIWVKFGANILDMVLLREGCTNPGARSPRRLIFTVIYNMCESSAWSLLHVTLLARRILRWLLNFWKTARSFVKHLWVSWNSAQGGRYLIKFTGVYKFQCKEEFYNSRLLVRSRSFVILLYSACYKKCRCIVQGRSLSGTKYFWVWSPGWFKSTVRNVGRHYVRTHFVKLLLICLPVSVKFSGKLTSQEGCRGFRGTKMRNAGRVLFSVLNLYVRIKIRVATFDTNHSVTDSIL